ncbi:MAG: hypothetical protein LWW95_03830 [Candidatus Desulfofervidus auxilii]|nr:hypothetical protein [Candidatus Desulfofervidus auxilii]
MPISIALIRKLEEVEPRLRGVLFAILEEIEQQREETVTKKEFNELKEIVKELAEAQKRTEQRVEELAQAQKRTEEELQKLIKEHAKTREQVGGLSITVGYVLENEAMKALPTLLEQEFGLKVEGKFVRKFVKDKKGKHIEVNIIGEAVKNSKKIVIIGQSKLRLSKEDILEFLRDKIIPFEEIFEEIFPILVTHMITQPDVEEYAYKHGIKRIYYSYEF